MLPYFALALVAVALAGAADYVRRRSTAGGWNPFDVLTIIALVSFSALRHNVGTDYRGYATRYLQLENVRWGALPDTGQESGFIGMQLLLHRVSHDPAILFWVTSALSVIPVYAVIRKRSLHGTMAVALFILLAYYVTPFNVIRQGTAAALLFWAASFLPTRRRAFIAIACAAALFHVSAILAALLIYFSRPRRFRLTKGRAAVALVVATGVALSLDRISLLRSGADLLNPRYETYIGVDQGGIGALLILAAHAALLLYALAFKGTDDDRPYVTWTFIGILFLIVGTQDVVLGRMALYFTPFLVLLVPNRLTGHKTAPIHKMAVLVAASAYFAVYLSYFGGLLPYQTLATL